ncbi:hypothetical protein D9V37_10805 [Nocardioides mangrovicus]|uniref:Uncharacterized protein n=1 Tax=Nocardioides mangrovicus TaxID=2478913 RepID=A0A3L8P3Q6_9ACTN|nr:hypothetical protein D9V37_10805 [Nocardioides mangrovicus]
MRHLGDDIDLEVHNPSVLDGLTEDDTWRSRAAALAAKGQRVRITHDGLHFFTLGAPDRRGSTASFIRSGSWPTLQ